jgi:hypothetical protein
VSPQYAATTGVSSEASRGEIERTLTRYGATSFMYAWQDERALVGFVAGGSQVRFVLPLPDRQGKEFTHTPSRGNRRSDSEAAKAYEQAVKQRWRALALVIKAKLEAVEAGIVTFEEEFAMHMVLPGGRTVADEVLPAIDEAYATGAVRPLLQLESGPA